jgi:hypothetical protein
VCAVFVVLIATLPALAQATSFTYQGRLTDSGTPANGNYDFQFTLWDASSGGTQQPQPNPVTVTRANVSVSNGAFTVQIDFGANAFPGADRFLEISARPTGGGSFTLLSPRQPITSTPYAIRSLTAASADTVVAANITGTLSVANGGTGLATLPSDGLLLGAGMSTPTSLAPGAKGNVVKSTGSAWASSPHRTNEYDVENYASFGTALAAIGSTTATLYIPSPQFITASTMIPSTVTLVFTGQGALNVTTGQTVTIAGPLVAPARQIFAGGGTIAFTNNKSINEYSDKWWGTVGNGTTDDQPALARAVTAVPNGSTLLLTNGNNYRLGSTLTISDRDDLHIISRGSNPLNANGNSPRFIWGGASGGTMISMDRCRFVEIAGIYFNGNGANIAIDIDGFSPGRISTNNYIRRNAVVNSANNSSFIGIRISETVLNNNEFMQITDNYIQPSNQSPGVGTGIKVGPSANAKSHVIGGNSINNAGNAIWMRNGSALIEDNNFNEDARGIWIEQSVEPVVIQGNNAENQRQFALLGSTNSPTYVVGNRANCGTQLTATGCIAFNVNSGYVEIRANSFDQRPPAGGWFYDLSAMTPSNATLVFEGNRYQAGFTQAELNYPSFTSVPIQSNDGAYIGVINNSNRIWFTQGKQFQQTHEPQSNGDAGAIFTTSIREGSDGETIGVKSIVTADRPTAFFAASAIGFQAEPKATVSNNLAAIGFKAVLPTNTKSWRDLIGFLATAPSASTDQVVTNSTGLRIEAQKGVGVTNGYGIYQVGTSDTNFFGGKMMIPTLGSSGMMPLCRNDANEISTCSSSLRYKTGVSPYSGGLDVINRLRPISFKWKTSQARDLGLGAEDVAKVEPLLTFTNARGEIEGVKYDQLSVVLINAVKEQQKQIETLRAQNAALSIRLQSLEKVTRRPRQRRGVAR